MLRIGDFARLGGVSTNLLRLYDREGLLRPAWVDPWTRYRAYSPAQLPELRRILTLRDLGTGLEEIRRLVTGGVHLADVLAKRRAELEREREELDRRLASLQIRVDDPGVSGGPDIVVRPVAAQRVATLAASAAPGADLADAFHRLETFVRDAGKRASRPPGAIVHRWTAEAGREVDIFVPLRGTLPGTSPFGSRVLPACRAATVIHRGSYDGLLAARDGLADWVERAGYQPVDPLRILYLQFGAERDLRLPQGYLVTEQSEYVTELQLPVA